MAIETSNVDELIRKYWSARAIKQLRANTVASQLVRKDFDDTEIMRKGDTVKVPVKPSIEAKEKSEGSDLDPDSPDTDTVDVVLDRHLYASWTTEDYAASLADEAGIMHLDAAMVALAEEIDELVLEEYSAAGDDVGSFGDDLDTDLIVDAGLKFNENKVPQSDRIMIVSPKDHASAVKEEIFHAANIRGEGETALENAQLGRTFGFDFFMSQLVPTTSDGSNTHNLAFRPDALALVCRPLAEPMQGIGTKSTIISDPVTGLAFRYTVSYNGMGQKTQHTLDCVVGVKVLDADQVLEVRT